MNIPSSTIDLSKRLAAISDATASMLSEHTADNNGEILPHVLFGDYSRHAIELAGSAQTSGAALHQLDNIIDLLDEAISGGDHDVVELISVSFLEAIEGTEVVKYLGPELQAEMLRIESGRAAHPH